MTRQADLERARNLASSKQLDDAYKIADRYLSEDPNDVSFLTIMVYIMLSAQKPTVAYHLAKRASEIAPQEPGVWMNLGMAANDLWLTKEARKYYERGLKVATEDGERSMLCVNISSVLIDTGHFKEAEEFCHLAIKYNPESKKGRANLGFCQLAQRNFKEGWKNYHYCMGSDFRPIEQYNDEPEWDGKGEGTIVVYAEQGLGDVISFGSMVPDLLRWASSHNSRVILDVDPKLKGLFARTFPEAKVYGSRGQKVLNWEPEDQKVDYSIAMGQLGEFFRDDASKFGDGVFLKPDPDRVLQWKALFESKGKPVIGIAWRGGILRTGAKFRHWELEQLLPILKSVDAHWVSLQYKPASREIKEFKARHPEIDIVEYPHGTLTFDYDDTVAMIAAMDQVVCMQTAVTHVAGGLGISCWTFVPRNSQWRYGEEGEDFPWAKSVRIIRQQSRGRWDDVIDKTAEELRALYPLSPGAAAKAARGNKVRKNRKAVRKAGLNGHRPAGDRHGSGLRRGEVQVAD